MKVVTATKLIFQRYIKRDERDLKACELVSDPSLHLILPSRYIARSVRDAYPFHSAGEIKMPLD